MDLKNKTAVITGASSGIGRAVARNLNQAGVKLVLTGRRADRLEAVKKEAEGAVALAGDITDPALPGRLIQTALDSFGRCDIVFNNAGAAVMGTVEEVDIEEICQMARINVEAAYRMAYTALKHFKTRGTGFLLNTSSIVGTKVRPGAGAYSGTKHAMEALTEGLRMEVAKTGISVACVQPGLTRTDLYRGFEQFPSESFGIPTPLEPEDIARVVRFVLEQPDHVRIPRVLVIPTDQAM